MSDPKTWDSFLFIPIVWQMEDNILKMLNEDWLSAAAAAAEDVTEILLKYTRGFKNIWVKPTHNFQQY